MAAAKLTLLRRLAKQAGIPRHTAAALDETWRRVMMRLLFVLIRTTVILEHIFVRDWVPSIDEVDEAEHAAAGVWPPDAAGAPGTRRSKRARHM